MERHGHSLGYLYDKFGAMSVKDVVLIAIFVIKNLEFLHFTVHICHGDVHSGNVSVGLPGQKGKFYLVDFSELYALPKNKGAMSNMIGLIFGTAQQKDLLMLGMMLEGLALPTPSAGFDQIPGILQNSLSIFHSKIFSLQRTSTENYADLIHVFEETAHMEGLRLSDPPDMLARVSLREE